MKKKLLWIITLVLMLVFAVTVTACDEEKPKDPPPPTVYTVTVPTTVDGGTVTASASEVTAGEKLTLTVTALDGYALTSLKVNDESVTLSDGKYEFTPTSDVAVTATFSAIKYNITYVVEGGTLPDGAKLTYTVKDGEIALPTPTRTGSDFLGWYDADYANEFTKIDADAKGDKTFYALWELTEYDITYDLTQAPLSVTNPNTDLTYNIDDEIELLPLPDTAEKIFKGWQFVDGEAVTVLGNGMTGAVTVKAIYEDRGIILDGAIDASWESYENACITTSGAGVTVTAYERIVNGGLFVELKIEHTSAIVSGNSPIEWFNDSYVATFLAGQNTDEYEFKSGTTELLSKTHQYQFASGHNPKWNFAKMTTTGDATDGFVTIIELYEALDEIKGYSDGDEYIRVGLGLAWFNGNKNEIRVVRGQYGNGGLSTEQKYYENGYFVTENGAYALDPTKYHITLNDGTNGSVVASEVEFETEGTEEATLTITPNAGYELDKLFVGETEVTALVQDGEYKFTPSAYITEVEATWKTITYTIEYAGVPTGVTNSNEASYTVEDAVTFADLEDTDIQIFLGWKEKGEWITSTQGKTGNLTITAVYENIVMVSASGTVKSASYTLGSTPYALDETLGGTVTATCTESEYAVIVGKSYEGTIAENGTVSFDGELPVGTYSITVKSTDYKETTASLTVAENGANAFEATVAYRNLTKGNFENGAYSISRNFALSSENEKYNGATFIEAKFTFIGEPKLDYECSGGIVATGTGTIGHGSSGKGFNVYLINTAYATNSQGAPDKIRIGRHNYAQATADIALLAEDYNGDGSVTLTVVRYDGTWYVYANGNFKQAFDGDALLGGTSWQVGIQGEARDIIATNLAISGNEQLVREYVTSKTDILMDGKLDEDWTSEMKNTVTVNKNGATFENNSIDIYARLTDAGLYSEIVINHTTFVNDKTDWWNNSYVASFIAGAHYTAEQSKQHAFGSNGFANGVYISQNMNHKDNGDGTHTTVIEMLKPYSTIEGYTVGDNFVRMAIGFAWWNGNNVEYHWSTGFASTTEQKYYANGFFITNDGIKVLNPTLAAMDGAIDESIWNNYPSTKVTNENNAGQKVNVYSRLVDSVLYAEVKIVHTGALITVNSPNAWYNDSYIATFITGKDESKLTFKNATTKQLNGVHQHRWTAGNHVTNWNYTNSKTTYDEATSTYTTVVELVKSLKKITGYTDGDTYVRMAMGVGNFESGKTSYITTNSANGQDMLNLNYYITANGMFNAQPQ